MNELIANIYEQSTNINGREIENIRSHSEVVKIIALSIAQAYETRTGTELDLELIEAGAMIHDIGLIKEVVAKSVAHGEVGYKWMIKNDYPEKLARFCLTHVGTGLDESELIEAGMDTTLNHCPETIEEIIVAFADKFTSKGTNKLYINSLDYIEEKIGRYGQRDLKIWQKWWEMLGMPNLEAATLYVEKYNLAHGNN